MADELDYVYTDGQVEDLVNRALDVYFRVAGERVLPDVLQVPVFNTVVNMVATIRQAQLVPQGFVLPPQRSH